MSSITIFFFFFNDTANTEIYTVSDTLSLHDALPILHGYGSLLGTTVSGVFLLLIGIRSEEHTSELQSPDTISYAVFCLKKKKKPNQNSFFCHNYLIEEYMISKTNH